MTRELEFSEWRNGLHAQHETKPRAGRAVARVIPGETFRSPGGRVGGEHEIEELGAIVQSAAEVFPIVNSRLDELGQALKLDAPNGSLDVEWLEIVPQVRVNEFVIVAFREFAKLPIESFPAGVVLAAGAPAIAAPIAEALNDRL